MTGLRLRLLCLIACAGVLAGCAQSTSVAPFQVTPSRASDGARPASAHYKDLYDFQPTDYPVGNLTYSNGKLYGTTDGGTATCPETGQGCGTVFSVNVDGTGGTTVHTFTGTWDGGFPESLVAANGNLYGSAGIGGAKGLGGLVFKVTPAGKLTVLHQFGAKNDGYYPGSLTYLDGALYGITADGGLNCKTCGTVFRLSLAGQEAWVHTFGNGFDGLKPSGSLIAVGSTLYGTTAQGGAYMGGTVFKISESGKERVIHGFGLYNDRLVPDSPLAAVSGTLYGMAAGGKNNLGAIFSMALDGSNEQVRYNFQGSASGSNPAFGLVAANSALYGLTTAAGPYGNVKDGGTIYSLPIHGTKLQVVHGFGIFPDGYDPVGPLVYVNGTFYGMTMHGGKNGGGMVFSLSGVQ